MNTVKAIQTNINSIHRVIFCFCVKRFNDKICRNELVMFTKVNMAMTLPQ